jgi:transposase
MKLEAPLKMEIAKLANEGHNLREIASMLGLEYNSALQRRVNRLGIKTRKGGWTYATRKIS